MQLKSKSTKKRPALQRSAELASEDGTSSWLTAIPLNQYGFTLHKGTLCDALCLCYGWIPPHLYSLTLSLWASIYHWSRTVMPHWRIYPSIHHNELRDTTANLLNIIMEPSLQPLTREASVGHENKHKW